MHCTRLNPTPLLQEDHIHQLKNDYKKIISTSSTITTRRAQCCRNAHFKRANAQTFSIQLPPSNAGDGYLQDISIAFIIHLKFPRKVVILQLANLSGPPDYIKTTVRGKRAQQNNKMILMPIAHYKFHFMYSAIFGRHCNSFQIHHGQNSGTLTDMTHLDTRKQSLYSLSLGSTRVGQPDQ